VQAVDVSMAVPPLSWSQYVGPNWKILFFIMISSIFRKSCAGKFVGVSV